MRKRELEARIEILEQKIYEMEMERARFKSEWKSITRNMIESRIKDRIHLTVVENLAAYEKGKQLKAPIRKIEEIL